MEASVQKQTDQSDMCFQVNLDVIHLRICVNVDFLMQLGLFFVPNLTQMNDQAIEKLKEVNEQVSALKQEIKPSEKAVMENTRVTVKLEMPQIILYDNQDDLKKSNCLTIQVHLLTTRS